MKHIYNLFIFLCVSLTLWSCKDSEEIAQASLTLNNNELSFTGFRSSLAVKVDATRRWNAIPSDYWISVSPDHYPGANEHFIANVAVTVSDNETGQPREGHITFFLQDEEIATLIIKQDKQNEEERPEEEFPITWANLQWAASTSITEGESFEAGSCVFADGITNAMESTTGEGIVADIGYSLSDTDPSGPDWTWTSSTDDCWFNGDWGDNFYYQGHISGLPAGTYYYTFRIRNGSGPYKYAGTGGLWNGIDNVNGTFEVKEASGGGDDGDDDDGIDYSKLVISWVNLQWRQDNSPKKGEAFNAGSKIEIKGLTDLEEAATSGNKHLTCEIGYSATSSDPSSGEWIWTTCPWSGDWGNEWYYQGFTSEIPETGTYYYSFRYRIDDGAYTYVGTNGIWDGTNNVCGTFEVEE